MSGSFHRILMRETKSLRYATRTEASIGQHARVLTVVPDPLRNAPAGGILSVERRVSRWDFSACVPGLRPDGRINDTRNGEGSPDQ